jgi:hypothetical protein
MLELDSEARSSKHSGENTRCSRIECYATGAGCCFSRFGDGNYAGSGLFPSWGQWGAVSGASKQTSYAFDCWRVGRHSTEIIDTGARRRVNPSGQGKADLPNRIGMPQIHRKPSRWSE